VIRDRRVFTAAGSFALAIAIVVWNYAQNSISHFGSGFLFGLSIALLILGLTKPKKIPG